MKFKSMPLSARVGARIKECRIQQRLSQDDLAMRSGVGQKVISKIETSFAIDPHLSTVYKIAKGLKTTLESLTWGTDK